MITTRRARRAPYGLTALILALWGSVAAADSRWTLRGHALGWSPGGDEVRAVQGAPPAEERTRFRVADGGGYGLELEYRLQPRLGLEVAALAGELDGDFRLDANGHSLSDSEKIGVEAYTAGVNYHFTPGKRVDLFAGGFAGFLFIDDSIFLTEAGRAEKLVFDDDTGLGLRLGIDLPFQAGGSWSFSAGLRYFDVILESETPGQDLDAAPMILSLGIGHRF
jgi:outer membrane protein W